MEKLITDLLQNGIFLFVEKDTLKVKYNGNSMSDVLLKEIRENKNELIEYLKKEKVNSNYQEIISLNTAGPFELSSAQRRIWVLSQIKESSLAYNIQVSSYLEQDIDIECFKRAIDSTIDRHEILRTVFKENEIGEIRQWVLNREDLGFKIDYKDFRKAQNKQDQIKSYINEYSNIPFDLKLGPLLRACLLQIDDEKYIFYLNMHHIITDGWSMEILTKNVLAYYEAYKKNKTSELKPLKIQYKDYSAWQLAKLEDESFSSLSTYWLDSLSGELPLLDLPTSKLRPRIKTYNGHGLLTHIDVETTNKLKKYLQENGGSLFMGLLAAWNILMYRYTSQSDIIIGTPVAGREHADLEDQIGFYVNTLALRNEVNPDEDFNTFYRRVKDNTLKSYSHQMYPFDRLVEELDIKGDTSRSAIFDVMLTLLNNVEKSEGHEFNVEEFNDIVDLGYTTSPFDIRIMFKEIGNHLSFNLTYNPDVYDRKMIEGLLHHFKQILNAILENPEKKISHIDYISPEEKHELLINFNNTEVAYPEDKTIVELFEEQVAKNPNQIAVVFEQKELTYGELNTRSNQLAQLLREDYGITTEDLVGIQLDRSELVVICILGILKAGGAYVPIDPEYPDARKKYIIEDTSLKLLITEANFIHNIDYYDGPVFAIDVEFEPLEFSISHTETPTTINNLAYVMYTSGSTGAPKGVMVEQKSIIRLVKNANFFNVTSDNKILSLSNFSFDGSTFDIFMPLLNGARLIVTPKDIVLNLEKLDKIISDKKIDSFFLTTALFNALVDAELESLGKLKCLLFGGEAVSIDHVNSFRKLYPSVKIHHVYGPTENTTYSTWYEINSLRDGALTIPIGSGISNSSVYILDEYRQIIPKGIIGEIYVGGAGLARGYLNQIEFTKEKFVENPFKPGERLYKTGDLGRWLMDGNIEFKGRTDDQVKIRGHRIEPGEIRHVLLKKKQLDEAIVIAREKKDKERELIAYIIANEKQNVSELKNYLKETLPDYMIPKYFIQLKEIPLTGNGKIDKKSLPDPETLELGDVSKYVPPRNDIEEKLVMIWEEVLKRQNIGVKDDFFSLGGHSLKIIRVINQVNKQFNLQYDLKGIYAEPTIEAMALQIKTDLWFIESKNENDYNEVKI